jgi:hypothetical protein
MNQSGAFVKSTSAGTFGLLGNGYSRRPAASSGKRTPSRLLSANLVTVVAPLPVFIVGDQRSFINR